LRYPPRGHRSVADGLPHFGYAKLGLAETVAGIDAATLVIVLLETPTRSSRRRLPRLIV